jgi:hypothetical protein
MREALDSITSTEKEEGRKKKRVNRVEKLRAQVLWGQPDLS